MYECFDNKVCYWELITFLCLLIIVYKCFQNGLKIFNDTNEREDYRSLQSTIRRHNFILNVVFVALTIFLMLKKLQDKKPVEIGLTCSFNESTVVPLYFTLLEMIYGYNILIAVIQLANFNHLFNASKLLLIEILLSIVIYLFTSYSKNDGYIHFWSLIIYETIILLAIELLVFQRVKLLCFKKNYSCICI